jgi:hypothetical protein
VPIGDARFEISKRDATRSGTESRLGEASGTSITPLTLLYDENVSKSIMIFCAPARKEEREMEESEREIREEIIRTVREMDRFSLKRLTVFIDELAAAKQRDAPADTGENSTGRRRDDVL